MSKFSAECFAVNVLKEFNSFRNRTFRFFAVDNMLVVDDLIIVQTIQFWIQLWLKTNFFFVKKLYSFSLMKYLIFLDKETGFTSAPLCACCL